MALGVACGSSDGLRGSSMAPLVLTGRLAKAPAPVAVPLTADEGRPLVGRPLMALKRLPAGVGAAALAMPSVPPPEPPAALTKVLGLATAAGIAISGADVRCTAPVLPLESD